MGFFRVIHCKFYDSERGNFKSLAFAPSSDKGISVVDLDCSVQTSGSICGHISRFYPNQAGDPAIYWRIPDQKIPEVCSFEPQPSTTGDDCHFNIYGWTRAQSRSTFVALRLTDFTVCTPDGERSLQQSDSDWLTSCADQSH
jgi:hypothetical protein